MHKLTFDSIHPNAVLKFLPLIKELAWEVPLNPTLFPPGSLEGIEQLSIMPHMSRIVKNGLRSLSSDQFGPSPRLQELKVRSLTPEFIYSGIPWSNLRSLMLDSWNGHPITPELDTAWSALAKGIPIDLRNLRELTLESRFELLDVILTALFPWHQLTSLTIHSEDSFQSCSLLFNPLRQSTNLIKLSITSRRTQDPRQPLHYPEHDLITLSYLQNLRFSSAIPFPMIKHIISSGVLCSLNAERISVSDLYFLAQECPRLSNLTALISPSTDHLSSGSSTIIMSSFKHLNITFWLQKKEWSATSFPTLLTTPYLTSLEIYVQACHSVPLHLVTDLISRSHAQLSHFSCRFSYPASVHPSESLLPLLNTLRYATVVDFSCVVCSQGVLDLLATGSLLPRLKRLVFTTSDLEQSASTIKSRLLYEESQGNVNLKQIVGYIRTDFVEDADDNGDEHSNSTSTEDAEDEEDDLESTSVVEDVDDDRRKHLLTASTRIDVLFPLATFLPLRSCSPHPD
ncbi:hypothetical protein H0H93_004093 [Arthromyces matolae]|nr:hypothetical protein H0H93_004093 [Arthromyces matolae]